MTNLFISDLHLEESQPAITALFLQFLKDHTKPTNTLYILGDFFEAWIGDDDLSPFNQSIINALQNATRGGLPIYIMHGNRDFLLGKKFMAMTGCKLLPDEYIVHLAGKPTLLMHGDTLCTADVSYLKFRKKMHNWFFQKLILMKSIKSRRALAAQYREKSKDYIRTAPDYMMDVTQAEVERIMQKYGVQQLIHGHTHRPATHHFTLNAAPAARTVLGAWHDSGNALIYDEKGSKEFITFS